MPTKFRSALPLLPALALAFAACTSKGTEPQLTDAQISTDLKDIAANVKYMGATMPDGGASGGFGKMAKRAAAKRAADPCAQEGFTVENSVDTSAAGVTTLLDSTWNYLASGKLVCAEEDETAYSISHSRDENAAYVATAELRTDFTYGGSFFPKMTISGNGQVHYKSGYDVKLTSIAAVFDFAAGKFDVSETLSLEDGRYQVVLKPAQPINPSSDKEPGPKEVAATGAITHGGQTVGWFEVLGDDTVIIRDADRKIIETHA